MRVFTGFFGITRSLRFTARSIQEQVFRPIREAGLEGRRFGHFHLPDRITNQRSGEAGIVPDGDEAKLLDLDHFEVEPQRPELVAGSFDACRCYPDHFGDRYATMRNLCFQLRSLDRLWSLMASEVSDEDWVLFLRPDLLYLDPLDVAKLTAGLDAGAYDMAVPRWHCWGGLNDRFALCNAYAAGVYATRGRLLAASASETGGLHPESLLAYAARHAGLHVGTLDARAMRIRADGSAAARDIAEFGEAGVRHRLAS